MNLDPVEAYGAAVVQRESTRLGLINDNDFIYYTFGVAYTLKPHRFQLDLAYFRDRFTGAPTGTTAGVDPSPPTAGIRPNIGFQGQRVDSVMISPSWSGTLGPVAALVQGYIVTGTARSGNLPATPGANRHFDIFAWGGDCLCRGQSGAGGALYGDRLWVAG